MKRRWPVWFAPLVGLLPVFLADGAVAREPTGRAAATSPPLLLYSAVTDRRAVAALFGVALAGGLAVSGPGAQPRVEKEALVFWRAQFFAASPTGEELRPLRGAYAAIGDVWAWSPDLTRIAFRGAGDGVYVMRTDGTGRRRLVSGDIGEIVWSPDGRQLAFVDGSALEVIGVDGTGRRRITSSGKWPKWAPDGRIFFFRDSPPRTYVTRPGQAIRRFPRALLYETAFSADGRMIAHWDEPTGRLVVSDLHGNRIRTFAARRPLESPTELAWSPVNDVLGVATGAIGLVISPTRGIVRRFTLKCCRVTGLAWSRDGRRLVLTGSEGLEEEDPVTDLWVADADGSPIRRITRSRINGPCCALWVPRTRVAQMLRP